MQKPFSRILIASKVHDIKLHIAAIIKTVMYKTTNNECIK